MKESPVLPYQKYILSAAAIAQANAGSPESLIQTNSANFSAHFAFKKRSLHQVTLPPGARTSLPHAESLEEEFVYVISGTPHVWIDGFIYELAAGCAVGFPAGTGISHCLILIEPYLKTVYSAKRIRLGISDENDVCAFWRKMDFSENGWTYQWKGEQKTARVVEFDKQL